MMRLYDNERAPNTRRVRIFLAEKGIEVQIVPVDIMSKEHKKSEFELKNPMMRVPVLELDKSTFISESVAICRYFEELHPEPPLLGRSALEKAMVEMWGRRAELGLYSQIGHGFRHTNAAMSELEIPQIPDWGIANQQKIAASLAIFDNRLADEEFVVGDTFTIADITLMICIDFMRVLRRSIPEEMHNLDRWYQNVSSRPSARA